MNANAQRHTIERAIRSILPDVGEFRIQQVYNGDYPKNVFIITTDTAKYVLKAPGQYEIETYENYLQNAGFDTPALIGKYKDDETNLILISFIEGNDLSRFCSVYAVEAAKSIAKEALIKSARAGSERFWSRRKYGNRGNTVCIS